MTVSKIAEVFGWIGAALSMVGIVLSAAGKLSYLRFITDLKPESGSAVSIGGFSLEFPEAEAAIIPTCVIIFTTVFLICVLAAMVMRNICLIFKTTEGKTKFSKGSTPFQPDNIRMVREIGIFMIAMPVVELILAIIARIVIPGGEVEMSVNLVQVIMGMVVLALSQYFAYGMELQNEVDGLV